MGSKAFILFVDWQILVPPHAAHHTTLFQIFVPTHLVQIGTSTMEGDTTNYYIFKKLSKFTLVP